MKVQFRIDGVLAQAATIARAMAAGVISRIKIMANLDIAEKRTAAGRPPRGDDRGTPRSTSAS